MFTQGKEYWYTRTSDFGRKLKKKIEHSLKTEMDLDSPQLLHVTQRNHLKQLPNTSCTSLVGATFKTGRIKTNKQKELRLFSANGTVRCAKLKWVQGWL